MELERRLSLAGRSGWRPRMFDDDKKLLRVSQGWEMGITFTFRT